MKTAPIVFFAYNRPWHVRRTIEALQNNEFAAESELIIFSDGPRNEAAQTSVEQVRGYLKTVTGFKRVQIHERKENLGLADSIIDGVSKIVSEYGRVIVLEDDLVTSPHFLRYMNEALDLYEHDDRVISVHGYVYPVEDSLPETFLLRGADCWGWATWKRGWDLFRRDGRELLQELEARRLTKAFDFHGTYPFTKMLKAQIAGENHSWAVRWYASAFLDNKLTLYPGRSLVRNIGNEGSGTHCGVNSSYDSDLSSKAVTVARIDVLESIEARRIFEEFFRSRKTSLMGFLKKKVLEFYAVET